MHNAAAPASIKCISRDFCDRHPIHVAGSSRARDREREGEKERMSERASAIKAHDNAIIHDKDLPPLHSGVMRQLHGARNSADDEIAALVKIAIRFEE